MAPNLNNPSLHLNLRVAPSFTGDFDDVKDAQLWRMSLDMVRDAKTARVTVVRAARPLKNVVPAYFKRPLAQRFGYSYEGSWADVEDAEEPGYEVYFANTLSVGVSRAVGSAFEEDYGALVALHLEVQAGASPTAKRLKVDSVLEMTLDDPFGFGRNAVYDTLDALGDDGSPAGVDSNRSDADVDVDWEPAREATETHGDVRLGTEGVAPAYPGIEALRTVQCREEDDVHDAELAFGTAPHDKYEALAGVVQRAKAEGPVLVIGDHPGTLGRALASRGIDVVGVDPLNLDGDHEGGQRFGHRRLYRRELRVNAIPDFISEVDWGAVVADTSTDDEGAEASTARNLAFCRLLGGGGKRLAIAQVRSVPLIDGVYDAFRLPGHSRQGCELYVSCGSYDRARPLAYCRVRRDDGSMVFELPARKEPPSPIFSRFFEQVHCTGPCAAYRLQDHNWYHFVISRFFLEAAAHKKGWLDKTIREAVSPLALYADLAEYIELDDSRRSDLRSLFEGQRVTLVGGVSRGLLERVPTMRYVLGQRYSALAKLCGRTVRDPDEGVISLFSDPRAGVLLRGLSEIRQVLDHEPECALYSRVLPYESMSVLASRTIFTLVHQYVYAVRSVVGKPIHTWELQWLLWTLSVNGSRHEKIAYVLAKLRGIFFRCPTGRRAVKVSQAKLALDGFLGRLDDLRMRSAYVDFDPLFGAKIARGPGFLLKQARERSGSQRSYARSHAGESVAASAVPSVSTARTRLPSRGGGFSFSGFGGQF